MLERILSSTALLNPVRFFVVVVKNTTLSFTGNYYFFFKNSVFATAAVQSAPWENICVKPVFPLNVHFRPRAVEVVIEDF
ncbi:hypothetical protein RB195_018431 [Necator americanus]|uniref:Uncharacterized protein n=1 Tax=Necator americanus TaxID=51031 RepID=A0ABR1CBS6_NECAM